jgi:hypothetical protein
MAAEDIELPEDLIKLKVRLLTARAEGERIAAEEPEGEMLVIGSYSKRLPSEDQSRRLAAVRARATDLTVEFYRHPWEREPPNGNRAGIDKKLAEVAGALFAERHRSE